MKDSIRSYIEESILLKERCLKKILPSIEEAGKLMVSALKDGRKILIFGNGGSAADAQHWAAELVGRFETEREGLAAMALTTNTSTLTAVSNSTKLITGG